MSEARCTPEFPLLGSLARQPTRNAILLVIVLVLVNAALWIASSFAYSPYPDSRATLVLAWTLGLRHAVDADHIAAIDNVTRKLTQEGGAPLTVGLWFALGHSTVVVVAAIVLAVTAKEVTGGEWGITGTIVSAGFLFLIATINLVALVGIWRGLKRVRSGHQLDISENDRILNSGGMVGRCFRRIYQFINAPWKMYPLGLLFGLGFDTATEISLLAISANHAGNGMPLGLVMFLPALFTAGMTLIDTMDGIAMLAVYSWANIRPAQKLYYNFIVTLLSVLIAFIVGIIQVLGIIADKYELEGGIWDVVGGVGDNSEIIGYVIITTFVLMLLASAVVYRFSGLGNVGKDLDEEDAVVETITVMGEQGTSSGKWDRKEETEIVVST